jgi:iron complex transport system ATP-binding protein
MATEADNNALSVDRVTFGYGDQLVLEDVSLDVLPGERVAIVGANGAGKTTLLKLMANLLRPRAGTVRLGTRNVRTVSRAELAMHLGMVPQELALPFTLTVRDLVECGRTAYLPWFSGLTAADRLAVDTALASTGTTAYSERPLGELSGGERQRVVIAMALAQEPAVLLLDEPTQHLDLTRQGEVLDLVATLSRERCLSIVATMHDLNLAAQYFDRLIVLAGRRVVANGPPDRVMRADVLEAAYGGALEFVTTPSRDVPIVLPARRMARRASGSRGEDGRREGDEHCDEAR